MLVKSMYSEVGSDRHGGGEGATKYCHNKIITVK